MAKTKGISDELITLLGEADKRNGLPSGTMFSVMQQESGGQSKYIDAPDTYHYELNKEGKRVAGHTGKVSTAFGPFGILESTGANPGYGVAPLKDKSIEEQVRFASDYLTARSKSAGGLEAGLSGYGEGGKYGKQVMARIGKGQVVPVEIPMVASAAPVSLPVTESVNLAAAPQVQAAPVQVAQAPMNEADLLDPRLAYNPQIAAAEEVATGPMASMNIGQMYAPPAQMYQPNMAAFNGWGKRRV